VDVGGLEVEEVEEGGVDHGERGPRRGDSRGGSVRGGGQGGCRGAAGERSEEDAGREGLGGGQERQLARCARRCGSKGTCVLVLLKLICQHLKKAPKKGPISLSRPPRCRVSFLLHPIEKKSWLEGKGPMVLN